MTPLSIQDIAEKWQKDQPLFEHLGKKVTGFINNEITKLEILPDTSFRTKSLLSIIKKIGKKRRTKEYDYYSIQDKLGIRIICNLNEEMDLIDRFLYDHFVVKNVEYKKENLDFNKLDYISNHYDASINVMIKSFKNLSAYKDLVFEIQVRTVNQHAWSSASHSLSYKQEAEISAALKRKVFRLLSLYEIADDEFSSVNRALIESPDNLVYVLLRKLEGKIYKYAQTDFDRDTTIFVLKTLLNYFSGEEKTKLRMEIVGFIESNDSKIKRIFTENKSRFYSIPFLTQPEVFVVWYALESLFFPLDDNWENDFDRSELDQLSALWGKIIE